MEDTKFEFGPQEKLIGYVETDSGGLVIADGIWGDEFPSVSQERVTINLDLEKSKVPIFGFTKKGKRYILMALDDAKELPAIEGVVEVTDIPKPEGNSDDNTQTESDRDLGETEQR
jgi:hypothetical protein